MASETRPCGIKSSGTEAPSAESGYLAGLAPYWDGRFEHEGMVWGEEPSPTLAQALTAFGAHDARTLLVLGAGYGRNMRPFAQAGMRVDGLDVSGIAAALARRLDPALAVTVGSALDAAVCPGPYDAIYCFNLLHLFRADERQLLVQSMRDRLAPAGLAFVAAFSRQDASYGRGQQVEPHTFESRPGRPAHYYDADELREAFEGWQVLGEGLVYEPEDHGQGPHTHALRWILVRR